MHAEKALPLESMKLLDPNAILPTLTSRLLLESLNERVSKYLSNKVKKVSNIVE